MIISPIRARSPRKDVRETQLAALIEYLRSVVLTGENRTERFHAVFVDSHRTYIGDEAMGQGDVSALTVRMRDLFGRALALEASAIIVAHNHPSGDCRPSRCDIEATKRLVTVGEALDITLLDHLIFTHHSVYSMRAGGDL